MTYLYITLIAIAFIALVLSVYVIILGTHASRLNSENCELDASLIESITEQISLASHVFTLEIANAALTAGIEDLEPRLAASRETSRIQHETIESQRVQISELRSQLSQSPRIGGSHAADRPVTPGLVP
jgi:hypothetical protein